MAWCPKCRLEYRKGITVCADCGTELVDHLEEEKKFQEIMSCESEELADKFLEFLTYSNLTSGIKEYQEKTKDYLVKVALEDGKAAKKLFQAFYLTEMNETPALEPEDSNLQEEDFLESEEDTESLQSKSKNNPKNLKESSNIYVKREEKYNDLVSSAKIFYVFGVLGLIYVGINAAGILTFVNGAFSYTVYTVMFVACLVVGYTTQQSAKKTKSQIAEEEDLTTKVNQWLKNNITEESFTSIDEEGASDEVNYLNRTNYIKELLIKQFDGVDDSYADQIIEDFYNENF